MFARFRRADPRQEAARRLYAAIVHQARAPEFHRRFGIPDTIDGRFDLLALHVFLVMEGLRAAGAAGEGIGTRLATLTFESLEEALRELGVGDFGLARRIRAMADAFYGRLHAYASASDDPALAAAFLRNLYRGDEARGDEAAELARYARATLRRFKTDGSHTRLLEGTADFAPLKGAD